MDVAITQRRRQDQIPLCNQRNNINKQTTNLPNIFLAVPMKFSFVLVLQLVRKRRNFSTEGRTLLQNLAPRDRSRLLAVKLFMGTGDDKLYQRRSKMAATSVPLFSPSSQPDLENMEADNQINEFSFGPPMSQDASMYSGSIEQQEEFMESGRKVDESNGGPRYRFPFYSQIFNKKNYDWLLEVDQSGDDDDFNKPLL